MLVRDPDQDGMPQLDRDALSDFVSMKNRSMSQSALVILQTACFGPQCYKVGVHNRVYAGDIGIYRIYVHLYTSLSYAFPIMDCSGSSVSAEIANEVNCHGNGKCVQTASGPSCHCFAGWSGVECNSPSSFELQQLIFATRNITLLCRYITKPYNISIL